MDWVFIVFAVGTAAYIIAILKEFSEEVLVLDTELQHIRSQKGVLEEQAQTSKKEREAILVQIEEIKPIIQELERDVAERLKTIQHYEEEMAKRGKYRL
jgi:chromosome segregation ATPase